MSCDFLPCAHVSFYTMLVSDVSSKAGLGSVPEGYEVSLPEASVPDGVRSYVGTYVGTQGHWPRPWKANISELGMKVTFAGLSLRLLLLILSIAYYRV